MAPTNRPHHRGDPSTATPGLREARGLPGRVPREEAPAAGQRADAEGGGAAPGHRRAAQWTAGEKSATARRVVSFTLSLRYSTPAFSAPLGSRTSQRATASTRGAGGGVPAALRRRGAA